MDNDPQPKTLPWQSEAMLSWIQLVLDSYQQWTGENLIDRLGSDFEQGDRIYHAPFVLASHGTEADPILNYGNAMALELWEMPWEDFVATPSRLTAEPVNQSERASMLQQAATQGLIRNYRGVRISRTGKRFLVNPATVWNVLDHHQHKVGQAATFSNWTPVTSD